MVELEPLVDFSPYWDTAPKLVQKEYQRRQILDFNCSGS